MRASQEFKMLPSEYERKVGVFEHRVIVEWLKLQWNRPDRTDHYLMAIRAMLGDGDLNNPALRLRFEEPGAAKSPEDLRAEKAWITMGKSEGARRRAEISSKP
jgi:hypothetical protein